MKIYIVNKSVDMEFNLNIAVFSKIEKAQQYIDIQVMQEIKENIPHFKQEYITTDFLNKTFKSYNDSYSIEEFEVQ